MSWQDRDYAQSPTPRHGIYVPGAGPWTRSIVNVLLAINIGLFVLGRLTGGGGSWIYGFGVLQADPVLSGQVWRLLSAQYLHDPYSLIHIIFNMFTLHFFCRPLESMWGNRKFFALYTAGGVIANIVFVIAARAEWLPRDAVAVGASGCILTLVGVCTILFPTARVIVLVFPMTMRTAGILFTAYYVFNIFQQGWNYGGDICHLAGFGVGVLWAMFGETGRIALPKFARPVRKPRFNFKFRPPSRSDSSAPDQAEVDRILNKIQTRGVASLTTAEKATLQRATEYEQELDRRYGRTDRL